VLGQKMIQSLFLNIKKKKKKKKTKEEEEEET
jgi:hypothetical protein